MLRRSHFIELLIILALFLGTRIWAIHGLFLGVHARAAVQSALQELTAREGWLVSDMEIAAVNDRMAVLIHQPHTRGVDAVDACFVLDFASQELHACEK